MATNGQMYRNYWGYALPIIRKSQSNPKLFAKTNPTERGYVHGTFGKGGFYICCVVTENSARVEVVIDTGNKVRNKKAFDKLISLRQEIENDLGNPTLFWDHKNDRNMCTIEIELTPIDVLDKQNWTVVSKFHSEWSEKFSKVFIPRIKSLGL